MLSLLRCTNRVQATFASKILSRRYMKVSEKMELLLKQADNVPRTYDLIYRETAQGIGGFMYHTVVFVSCATVATLGYLWYNDVPINDENEHFKVFQNNFEAVIVTVGMTSTMYLALWTRKSYAIRMYYSDVEKKYRALFIGKIPFTTHIYEFPPQTTTYVSKDSIFPWRKSLMNCNGRKILLFEDKFKTQNDFIKMLKEGEY